MGFGLIFMKDEDRSAHTQLSDSRSAAQRSGRHIQHTRPISIEQIKGRENPPRVKKA